MDTQTSFPGQDIKGDRTEKGAASHATGIGTTLTGSPILGSLPLPARPMRSGPAFGRRRDLPVLGRAQGGSDGNIVIEDGAIDWTFRPADLQGVRDAFAVYVTGDSMAPKYKDRDMAYVHPGKSPRRGRYVLVETKEHRGFIKQFDRWDGDTLVLRQYNPAEEIRLARADVLRVMLVIGSLDC